MSPRGYRMLRKIPRLGDPVVDALICRFGSVRSMFDATVEELAAVDGVDPARANDITGGSGTPARTEPAGAVRMMFGVGDTVVYPQHGAGRILDIVEQDFQGAPRLFYIIRILHNDMTVMVPVDGVEKAGIRAVMSEPMVDEVLGVLRDDPTKMPKDWNRRIKHNREKIKSGDVLEIADVLRNLALRQHEKGLSTGEKQMYGKVKRILASEVMYAKRMREDDALRLLDGILAEICAQTAVRGAVEPWYSL